MGAAALKAGHSNTIFTVRDIVDDAGDVIQSYEFSEHGLPMPGSGAGSGTFSPKTYQGALSVNDDRADSGLYLMGHRHYAPELGRFISRDPIGFRGGLNLYGTHGVSPVTMVDPSGLRCMTDYEDQLLSDALGIIKRAAQVSKSPWGYRADQIDQFITTGNLFIDPTVGQGRGEANAMAVTHAGKIRLHPGLFQGVFPCDTKQGREERLKLATTLAAILLHEYSHISDPSKPPGFEVPRYQLERDFLRSLLTYEKLQIAQGNSTQDRYDTILDVAREREDQGYNQGVYGGNLSGPRYFP